MQRFLALGDSYTIGEAVAPNERWPVVLAERLGLPEPQIVARTGWTTDELGAAIDEAQPAGPFDLVTLLIGVNDQYRGRNVQAYGEEFVILLRRAIEFAGGQAARVIVVSIPDWGVTPFAADRDGRQIAKEIDRFNLFNRDETIRAGAQYADIVATSRQARDEPALTAADRLHPSAEMYRRWVEIILPAARVALGGLGP